MENTYNIVVVLHPDDLILFGKRKINRQNIYKFDFK